MAVDCRKFARTGRVRSALLPGRLEDLDLAFRGYQAGYHARYVPEAVAYHRGMATFGDVFGQSGCDRLALRNTLLFQWKNLRQPMHVARQLSGLAIRLAFDLARAPCVSSQRRWAFSRALLAAFGRWRQMRASAIAPRGRSSANASSFAVSVPGGSSETTQQCNRRRSKGLARWNVTLPKGFRFGSGVRTASSTLAHKS